MIQGGLRVPQHAEDLLVFLVSVATVSVHSIVPLWGCSLPFTGPKVNAITMISLYTISENLSNTLSYIQIEAPEVLYTLRKMTYSYTISSGW